MVLWFGQTRGTPLKETSTSDGRGNNNQPHRMPRKRSKLAYKRLPSEYTIACMLFAPLELWAAINYPHMLIKKVILKNRIKIGA